MDEKNVSRRKALEKLGLFGVAGFVAPTLLTISEAEAGGRRRKRRKKHGSGGSGGSGGSHGSRGSRGSHGSGGSHS
jgi:hypothetical protein